jgi:hypothetical protein
LIDAELMKHDQPENATWISRVLAFDHANYWAKNLQLFKIDFERLGRFYNNRRSGARRSKSRITGSWPYNRDLAAGSVLYHAHAWHPQQLHHSVQRFVDTFGRGPFLIPIAFFIQ